MNPYQEQLIENYKKPYKFGKPAWNNIRMGKSENLSCGDEITAYLNIEENKVKDVAFEGDGCSICIGTASLLSQHFEGADLKKISEMSLDDVIELIGIKLTASRQKCAAIGLDAFKKAAAV